MTIPWFTVGFIAMIGVNSLDLLPGLLVARLIEADAFLLATAMAAVGPGARIESIREAGLAPLALGAMLFAWLVLAGLAVNVLLA